MYSRTLAPEGVVVAYENRNPLGWSLHVLSEMYVTKLWHGEKVERTYLCRSKRLDEHDANSILEDWRATAEMTYAFYVSSNLHCGECM